MRIIESLCEDCISSARRTNFHRSTSKATMTIASNSVLSRMRFIETTRNGHECVQICRRSLARCWKVIKGNFSPCAFVNARVSKMDRHYSTSSLRWLDQESSSDELPGTGGLRKLRWVRAGMGKRGGARVIYYYDNETAHLYLFMAYAMATQETHRLLP